MSEFPSRRRTDQGMTLVELLIVVTVMALIAVVISAAVIVVLRQAPETTARVDSARWEQNLGTWLPADLTSAEWPLDSDFDGIPDDPTQAVTHSDYEPCPASELADCVWGDNVAHFGWTDNGSRVDVSYRYGVTDDGSYEFRRVECVDGTCTSLTLVRDMPEPVGGVPPISVTFPPPVTDTDPNGSGTEVTSGRSVKVTVNGTNGLDLLSFSGGSVERVDLEPAAIQPPQFLQARSGCGGPITLIVDESTSLSWADVGQVRTGVRSFVETFAGTPTQLQIIGFNHDARVLGAGSDWTNWYDLSEQAVVDDLLGSGSDIDTLSRDYATNWEDALYRAFYNESGQSYQALGNPAQPPSELIIFFTDGMPTYHRDDDRTGPNDPEIDSDDIPSHFRASWAGSSYTQFSPRAWYRASWLMNQQSTRVIGVGVGQAFGTGADLDDDTTLSWTQRQSWSAPSDFLPAEVALGDLIVGNDPSNYDGSTTDRYIKVSYSGGWDPEAVKDADLLTTTDFSEFGGALESIALAECGGTLTVQTRKLSDQRPLTDTVTYEIEGDGIPVTESVTSAVSKSAVFDIATESGVSADVTLRPRSLDGTGYVPHDWTCRVANAEITDPDRVAEADPVAGAAGGLDLTVAANEAMACVLWVVPE